MPDHSTPQPDLPSRPQSASPFLVTVEMNWSVLILPCCRRLSVPWRPALRHELAWEERAAVVSDQNGGVSVSTDGHERNFSTQNSVPETCRMSGNSICFNKKNGFPMQLISKQQTGKKTISSDTFIICAVFVHAQLPIWHNKTVPCSPSQGNSCTVNDWDTWFIPPTLCLIHVNSPGGSTSAR